MIQTVSIYVVTFYLVIVVYMYIVTVFDQDQHIGPSDHRFVDDSLVCKPAPIVS